MGFSKAIANTVFSSVCGYGVAFLANWLSLHRYEAKPTKQGPARCVDDQTKLSLEWSAMRQSRSIRHHLPMPESGHLGDLEMRTAKLFRMTDLTLVGVQRAGSSP